MKKAARRKPATAAPARRKAKKKAPAKKRTSAKRKSPTKKKAPAKKKTAGKKKRPASRKTATKTKNARPKRARAKAARKSVKKTVARKKPATRKKRAGAKKPTAKTQVKPRTGKPTKKRPAKAPTSKSSIQKKTSTAKETKKPIRKKFRPVAAPTLDPSADAKAARGTKRPRTKKSSQKMSEQVRKQLVARARARTKPQRAAVFTLDDVMGEIARAGSSRKERASTKKGAKKTPEPAPARVVPAPVPPPKQQKFGAASLADILGYNPAADEKPEDEKAQIPRKFIRYYRLLVELRNHVNSGLAMHTEDTLKRSNRDDSGDLSGYGQHMADAGTDAFDRDFALSLVSNEQEALFEIEEAIKRIKKGTYGTCELTGKPIDKERLLAVPFARYSVESQAEIEKVRRHSAQRAGVFAEATGEDGKLLEDDSD